MKDGFLQIDSELRLYQECEIASDLFWKNFEIYCSMYNEEREWIKERIICKYAMFDF